MVIVTKQNGMQSSMDYGMLKLIRSLEQECLGQYIQFKF